MGKGYILVRLVKAKEAIPLTQVKLKITNAEKSEVVYENDDAFDRGGISEIVEVTTTETRYYNNRCYNIYISANGYKNVIVEGICVFEKCTSIQEIEMIEEVETDNYDKSPKVIIIPPHQLKLNDTFYRQNSCCNFCPYK